jgi:hypothetical protein
MTAAEIRRALAAPSTPSQLSWTSQVVKDNRALAVFFIDVRDLRNRLDQGLGVGGWRDSDEILPGGLVVCRLSI